MTAEQVKVWVAIILLVGFVGVFVIGRIQGPDDAGEPPNEEVARCVAMMRPIVDAFVESRYGAGEQAAQASEEYDDLVDQVASAHGNESEEMDVVTDLSLPSSNGFDTRSSETALEDYRARAELLCDFAFSE